MLRYHRDTVSDTCLYAVKFVTELLSLRDSSYVLTDDVVFTEDRLHDLLSTSSSIFVYYNVVRRNTTHYNNKQYN